MRYTPYKRNKQDSQEETERLFNMGYRQFSRKYRMISRIDVPDVVEAIREKHPHVRIDMWDRRSAEDFWRTSHSQDVLKDVDEEVMWGIRKLTESLRIFQKEDE